MVFRWLEDSFHRTRRPEALPSPNPSSQKQWSGGGRKMGRGEFVVSMKHICINQFCSWCGPLLWLSNDWHPSRKRGTSAKISYRHQPLLVWIVNRSTLPYRKLNTLRSLNLGVGRRVVGKGVAGAWGSLGRQKCWLSRTLSITFLLVGNNIGEKLANIRMRGKIVLHNERVRVKAGNFSTLNRLDQTSLSEGK